MRAIPKKDMFHEREKAEENAYFRKRDAILIEKLRQELRLGEIAKALAEKLQVDNPELLKKIVDLGMTLETGAAFILSPLVEIAWADGAVTQAERDAVLRIAESRGVASDSPDMKLLLQWLAKRPSDEIFHLAIEAIKVGTSVLPPAEAKQRVTKMVAACNEVAEAAGGLRKLLGLHGRVSPGERTVLNEIAKCLEDGITIE